MCVANHNHGIDQLEGGEPRDRIAECRVFIINQQVLVHGEKESHVHCFVYNSYRIALHETSIRPYDSYRRKREDSDQISDSIRGRGEGRWQAWTSVRAAMRGQWKSGDTRTIGGGGSGLPQMLLGHARVAGDSLCYDFLN
jgi:hypothetical protein